MLGEGAHGPLLQSFIAYLLRLFIGFLVLVLGGNVLALDSLETNTRGSFFLAFFSMIKDSWSYSLILRVLHFG